MCVLCVIVCLCVCRVYVSEILFLVVVLCLHVCSGCLCVYYV